MLSPEALLSLCLTASSAGAITYQSCLENSTAWKAIYFYHALIAQFLQIGNMVESEINAQESSSSSSASASTKAKLNDEYSVSIISEDLIVSANGLPILFLEVKKENFKVGDTFPKDSIGHLVAYLAETLDNSNLAECRVRGAIADMSGSCFLVDASLRTLEGIELKVKGDRALQAFDISQVKFSASPDSPQFNAQLYLTLFPGHTDSKHSDVIMKVADASIKATAEVVHEYMVDCERVIESERGEHQ